MQVTLDTNKAKQQAKHLTAYLATQRKRLTHSQALEAVARIYGAREWNVLAAQLEQGGSSEPTVAGASVWTARHNSGERIRVHINADLSLDDGHSCTFDATPWFAHASDENILAIADANWGDDYATEEMAHAARDAGDAAVKFIFDKQDAINADREDGEEKVGFSVRVNPHDVWRFCRSFRYDLFVKLALMQGYGSITAAAASGIEVNPDSDQPGLWTWRNGFEGCDTSLSTEKEAWEELGEMLEEGPDLATWMGGASVMDFYRKSGECSPGKAGSAVAASGTKEDPALVAGRFDNREGFPSKVLVLPAQGKPLTKKQLRDITCKGEHRICIAVSVEMSLLIDGDIEALNDFVSERISGGSGDLADLSFERHTPPNEADLHDMKQNVYILVNAEWDPFDGYFDDGEDENEGQDSSRHASGLDRTYCESCGTELEEGQIGLCDGCQDDNK